MTDSEPPETQSGDRVQRVAASAATDIIMTAASNPAAYVVPGAYVVGKAIDAVSNIVVAKREAQASVEVARVEHGYPEQGGAHRAD